MNASKWMLTALTAAFLVGGHSTAQAQSGAPSYWQDVQKRGVLRCGAAIAPPYVIRDTQSGQYSGVFVDLCREFGEKVLGVKVEMVDTSWDNIVAGLQSGRWDVAMALNRTPKRSLAVAYSRSAWDYEIDGLYDRANPKFQKAPKSLDDVDKAGTTIAVVSGTAADQLLTAKVKKATMLRLPDVDATRLALSSRRADIYFDDADLNSPFAATDSKRWETLHPQPAIAKQGIAYALRRNATEADLQTLDIFIEDKLAVGEVSALGKSYMQKVSAPK
ncbi:transporter substrate-binding domain-containing protein [Paraburkholderia sp. BR13439]|uniref:transporter substrate-binding domain-containing protein n=1 Tax=unclassified Paraburkholderia TaxID=2615204 RepID=UPI0034CD4673